MPELPEVQTTLNGISPHILGKKVERVVCREKRLRWPIPDDLPALLEGETLLKLRRRGKYLLLDFSKGSVIWHLGMSGSLRVLLGQEHGRAPPAKHDHVDIEFADNCLLRFNDPRRFGCLLWTADNTDSHALIAHLGPEPLSEDFDAEYIFVKSRKRKQAIKTWLMDSKVVVGVGNIYANEALHAAKIHPLKAAGKITRQQSMALASEVKKILRYAIDRGGTTLRDFVGGDGKPGYFAQELLVYGRGGAPCKACGKALLEKALVGRATVYCSACQK